MLAKLEFDFVEFLCSPHQLQYRNSSCGCRFMFGRTICPRLFKICIPEAELDNICWRMTVGNGHLVWISLFKCTESIYANLQSSIYVKTNKHLDDIYKLAFYF